MLPEILTQNLKVVFVGTTVSETSDELGFYYLGPNDHLWSLLEYAGITPAEVVPAPERKVLLNAKKDGVLNEIYKKFFFEKKEAGLLRHRIGLTNLNRRRVIRNDDDPAAEPTIDDIQKFVRKVQKYRPKIVAFVAKAEIIESCLKGLYPSVNRQWGKQDFLIGDSEVWLLGNASGRVKDTDALEQVFEDLAMRLSGLPQSP
jgi:G:T/U-mismatch repair DNA glycosylase